jgi:hypothetical protein
LFPAIRSIQSGFPVSFPGIFQFQCFYRLLRIPVQKPVHFFLYRQKERKITTFSERKIRSPDPDRRTGRIKTATARHKKEKES